MNLGEEFTRDGLRYVVVSRYPTDNHGTTYRAYRIPNGESAQTMGRSWRAEYQTYLIIHEPASDVDAH